ncbi:MAG TPA: hypothetical protein VGG69_09430 [Rhizomicrobium sp.]
MKRLGGALIIAAMASLPLTPLLGQAPSGVRAVPHGHYQNFRVAIYIVVNSTKQLADPAIAEREYDRAFRQTHFDKVYLEAYRGGVFATDAEIEAAKRFLENKGVIVSGGITLAKGGQGGQFGTFDYENPSDRAECQRAVELAARHFNEVILDDFFFFTSKSDADIAAKGNRSWTHYRLERMREVAQNLVLKPARAINPRVRMIIKYPNWYEHFQGLGYDLDQEAKMFDAIHSGTETRDPVITDQLLQQYESYEIVRYFDNVAPGRNNGGWVDTFDTRYVDRYAEQLWDTMLAKAPEIVLFNWVPMSEEQPVEPGDRVAWANKPTTFNWNAMMHSYQPGGAGDPGPGWGQVAGYSLALVDKAVGKLGHPIGIASYKPYQSSSGEDFLQNYLGNIGVPIEMTPEYPANAGTVLLTENAKFDPDIVSKIKASLQAGHSVVITSGLLRALQGHGFQDIVEWYTTDNPMLVRDFYDGFGAGAGQSLNDPKHDNTPVLFPEIHFYTNDSWAIIRGAASAKGFPIVLMNHYSNGTIYLLDIPENMGDLYNLPEPVLTQIKRYIQRDFPVRVESAPQVALFAYDNNTFVVESYRPDETTTTVSVASAGLQLRNLLTGEIITAALEAALTPRERFIASRGVQPPPHTDFSVKIEPHSFVVFGIEPASAHSAPAAPNTPSPRRRRVH